MRTPGRPARNSSYRLPSSSRFKHSIKCAGTQAQTGRRWHHLGGRAPRSTGPSPLARGLSNAEIAKELYVTETTVRTHVTHVLQKVDLRDRVHAVIYSSESGLVQPGSVAPNSLVFVARIGDRYVLLIRLAVPKLVPSLSVLDGMQQTEAKAFRVLGFCDKPLPDSNRRPPPYHVIRVATGRSGPPARWRASP